MSYYDGNDLDRWYEYQEAMQEAEEWEERQREREREIKQVLESMTIDEYALVMNLNEKLREARYNISYSETLQKTEEEKATLDAKYNAIFEEFNKAVERWPILKNGF